MRALAARRAAGGPAGPAGSAVLFSTVAVAAQQTTTTSSATTTYLLAGSGATTTRTVTIDNSKGDGNKAGADNGTSIAALCAGFQPSCADMSGQSPTVAQLQAAWGQIGAQGIGVEVQWSSNDGVIIPTRDQRLQHGRGFLEKRTQRRMTGDLLQRTTMHAEGILAQFTKRFLGDVRGHEGVAIAI